jgi:hypothetical protein
MVMVMMMTMMMMMIRTCLKIVCALQMAILSGMIHQWILVRSRRSFCEFESTIVHQPT